MTDEIYQLAECLGGILKMQQLMLVTAESCTGGWIAQAVTAVPGSSAWFERGFITYSDLAKQEMLGVSAATLDAYGAVSEPTALAMAEGALHHSHGTVSISVTGIAGPAGGTPAKPVGLVCFGWAGKTFATATAQKNFTGDRTAVRAQAVIYALHELMLKLKPNV